MDGSEQDLKDELVRVLEAALDEAENTIVKMAEHIEKQESLAAIRLETAKVERSQKYLDFVRKASDHAESLSQRIGELELSARAGKIDLDAIAQMRGILNDLGVVSRRTPTPTVTAFLRDQFTAERNLREDAQRHIEGYVHFFAKATGDKALADYGRADVLKWVRLLEQLRASHGKRKGDREKTITQLLRESRGVTTLNRTTIEKHITHLKAFFLTSIKHYRYATSDDIAAMFDDIPLGRSVPNARPRKSWTIAQLNALFASPLWSGTRSRAEDRTKRHEAGPQIHRDAYWWLPVAALWTGARLEELAQLHHEDLQRDVNGIPYLRLHDEGERRLKTPQSTRNVPLHRVLRELGFEGIFRAGGRGRIWPELRAHGRPPSWGGLYSTHFTDYRRACGLYEPLRDFHSLRRTFITTLRTKARVDVLTVAALVGHDDSDPELRRVQQTDDYTDYDISSLHHAVEALDYPSLGLDLGPLVRAAAECGPRGSMRTARLTGV